jgi:vacuolar-type H+-ATPase subunit I/STV1
MRNIYDKLFMDSYFTFPNAYADPPSMQHLNLPNPSDVHDPHIQSIIENNNNLQTLYEQRKQLYDSLNLEFENEKDENPENAAEHVLGEDTMQELTQLKDGVEKAKQKLQASLAAYYESKNELEKVYEEESKLSFHVQSALMSVKHIQSNLSKHINQEARKLAEECLVKLNDFHNVYQNEFNAIKTPLIQTLQSNKQIISTMTNVYKYACMSSVQHICPICIQEHTTHFLSPCGHTYCLKCIERIGTKCFVCNQMTDRKLRLFT